MIMKVFVGMLIILSLINLFKTQIGPSEVID